MFYRLFVLTKVSRLSYETYWSGRREQGKQLISAFMAEKYSRFVTKRGKD
jgi:hypothetical protein